MSNNKKKPTMINFNELDKSIEKLVYAVRDLKLQNKQNNKTKKIKKKLNVELIKQLIKETKTIQNNRKKLK